MKQFLTIIFLLISAEYSIDTSKILLIYFTRTGNTELFANYIKEIVNISSFKIVPATAYPEDDDAMFSLVKQEQSNNTRPEIQNPLTDISNYDIILLGYPLWFSHLPNIVISQLEKLDLNKKTIYPFNTHGSSGIGNSVNEIKEYAKGANVKDGFPISASNIKNKTKSMEEIEDWLDENFDLDSTEPLVSPTNNNSDIIKFIFISFAVLSIILLLFSLI